MLMMDDIRLVWGLTPVVQPNRGIAAFMRRGFKPMSEVVAQFKETHTPWEVELSLWMAEAELERWEQVYSYGDLCPVHGTPLQRGRCSRCLDGVQ